MLTLPFPPYTNDQYLHLKSGRVILNPVVKAYRESAGWQAKVQMREQGADMLVAPLSLVIHLYRPRPKGDADGPVKQLLDAMIGIVYRDDSQVMHYEVTKHDDAKAPRVEVMVTLADATKTGDFADATHGPAHLHQQQG